MFSKDHISYLWLGMRSIWRPMIYRLISESGIPHVALACSSNWAAGRDPTDPRANIDHHSVDRLASTMRELVTYCIKSLLIEYTK